MFALRFLVGPPQEALKGFLFRQQQVVTCIQRVFFIVSETFFTAFFEGVSLYLLSAGSVDGKLCGNNHISFVWCRVSCDGCSGSCDGCSGSCTRCGSRWIGCHAGCVCRRVRCVCGRSRRACRGGRWVCFVGTYGPI